MRIYCYFSMGRLNAILNHSSEIIWIHFDLSLFVHQRRLVEFIISNVTSKNKALPGS